MSPILDTLFSRDDLQARLDAGFVRVRTHPTEPLAIANYSARATYEHAWDAVTRRCRGLIWSTDSGEIVARPFEKFFDLHDTRDRVPERPPVAHEKLDGSLGILYRASGGWAVATRGSFDSVQAIWATDHLRRHHPNMRVPEGCTPLVEILCASNRIVVEHDREGLALLAVIDNTTGADIPLWEVDWWPGPLAEQYVVRSADEGYRLATGNDFAAREGLVLAWHHPIRPSLRVKVKHPRYLELHRIVTASSERDVWRAAVAGDWRGRAAPAAIAKVLNVSAGTASHLPLLGEVRAALPPEFTQAVAEVESRLRAAYARVVAAVDELWERRPRGDRRTFAAWANRSELRSLLFSRLDGRAWELDAWAFCRPGAVPLEWGPSADDDDG